ncbi:hypothetical protein OP10G_1384 [Fimbriimonas ginsengisoli Gsoil 348]|uniref:Uncharacterized protein n=1 Tax=Fimbriimonas ginsengisoli Gsoil 348 TaxID=661478 RepID=A0A068NMX3_FIMGI|nr:hypothetical protein OP10G_1384 [Fimbriimonas ginsengisoli Gsoil 348]
MMAARQLRRKGEPLRLPIFATSRLCVTRIQIQLIGSFDETERPSLRVTRVHFPTYREL